MRATVRYRLQDGSYYQDGLLMIGQIFDVPIEEGDEEMSLRFLSYLDYIEDHMRTRWIEIVSGYRTPAYNQRLRDRGTRAARASLHQDGEAADFIFPEISSQKVWEYVQTLRCCGVGFYRNRKDYPGEGGTFHLDTGQPRSWTRETSGVDLKAPIQRNDRIIVRTDRDIYFPGETVRLKLAQVTDYPFSVDSKADLIQPVTRGKQEVANPIAQIALEGEGSGEVRVDSRPGRLSKLALKIPNGLSPKGEVRIRLRFRNKFPEMPVEIISNPIRILPNS
jgi:uncharacterized protein YcbK (DUF882 family)